MNVDFIGSFPFPQNTRISTINMYGREEKAVPLLSSIAIILSSLLVATVPAEPAARVATLAMTLGLEHFSIYRSESQWQQQQQRLL